MSFSRVLGRAPGHRKVLVGVLLALIFVSLASAVPAWAQQTPALTITKADSPDPVFTGQDLTYTITVRNTGADRANNVRVTDQLQANTTFVSASAGCTYNNGNRTVACGPFNLNAGATATRMVTVRPTQAGTLNNTATARADNRAAVSATQQTTVRPPLTIKKSDDPDPVVVGGRLTYTVTVTNASNANVTNVQIGDYLPAGVTFASASYRKNSNPPGGGNCLFDPRAARTVVCLVGDLTRSGTVGDTATATIVVEAPRMPGTITNLAGARGNNSDEDIVTTTEQTTVVTAADLSITKDDAPDPVTFGENLTYTVSVSNAAGGPDARDVRVTDALPQNVEFVSAGAGCSFDAANRTVVCDLGVVAAGSTTAREIVVRPTTAAVGTTVENRATVSSPNDPTDATATATTAVNAADLTVQKTDSPDPVAFGEDLTYTVRTTNNGGGAAENVTVTDPLPQNVTFVSAGAGCGFDGASRTVTCDVGTLAAGEGAVREIVVTPTAAAVGTTVSNTATARSPNDPDPARGTATTRVVSANLSVSKTGPATALAGQVFSYRFSVTNDGPASARDVTLSDVLPEGVAFDGPAPEGCSYDTPSRTLTCDLGTLAAGESESRQIDVTAPTTPGTIRNTATARSPNDPNGDRSSTATTEVRAAADLSATKTAPAQVTYGEDLTYVLTANNAGPNAAVDARFTDTLPQNVSFVSAGAGCDYTASSRTVRCDLGTLGSGQSVSRQVVVRPTAAAVGTTIRNAATVGGDTADPDDSDNRSPFAETRVVAADLRISKSDRPDPIFAGDSFEYLLTVENTGADAGDVTVTDRLPAQVDFMSAPGCDYDTGTRVVTCDLGAVGNGQTVERTIMVRAPDEPGAFTNTATVKSPNDPSNGRDAERTTTIQGAADLSVRKSAPGMVVDEETFTYALTVTNNGPSTAQDVRITDRLPAGVSFVSAPGGCSFAAGTVTCAVDPLASGATVTREITVRAKTPGETTNTATVDGSTTDRNPDNNSASATTRIDASADLSITKDGPNIVSDEQTFDYVLNVTNNGPSEASGVVVTDRLPEGIEFVEAGTDPRCDYDAGTRTLRCDAGDLGTAVPGNSTEIKLRARATTPGTLRNVAGVQGETDDPDASNNSSAERTTVVTSAADLAIEKNAPGKVADEQTFEYVLTVTNSGPSGADGVKITDELPAGVEFVSASDGCANASGTVTCDVGTLAEGATAERRIEVRAKQAGAQVNQATVESATPDPNGGNDRSREVTTTVTAVVDLSLDKQAPARVQDGQVFTYDLAVRNNGVSGAEGVVVTDDLPGGLEFVSASAGCLDEAGMVRCEVGGVPGGGGKRVEIRVRAKEPGMRVNRAEVGSASEDASTRGIEANNSDTATTRVMARPAPAKPRADLSIRKTAPPGPVSVGERLVYTLTVTNNGPDAASGVIVRDRLPRNAKFVSASGGCKNAGGTVTCKVDRLADGGSLVRKIVVRAEEAGRLRNTATVGGATEDLRPGNNSSTETTRVEAPPSCSGRASGGADTNDRGARGGSSFSNSQSQPGVACVQDGRHAVVAGGEGGGVQTR